MLSLHPVRKCPLPFQTLTNLCSSSRVLIIIDGLDTGWARFVNELIEDFVATEDEGDSDVNLLALVPYSQILQPDRFKNIDFEVSVLHSASLPSATQILSLCRLGRICTI